MAFFSSHGAHHEKEIKLNISSHSLSSLPGLNSDNSSSGQNSESSYGTTKSPNLSVRSTSEEVIALAECDSGHSHLSTGCHPDLNNHSEIVPPLDILSVTEYNTDRESIYSSCGKPMVIKKIRKTELAFEDWLAAKKKAIANEKFLRKKAEEQKRREQEARKRLAVEKYQEWLKLKSVQQARSKENLTKNKQGKDLEQKRSQILDKEARAKLDKWEYEKCLEIERRRILKIQEKERRQEMEKQRRILAAEAWKKWIADVHEKPKPVPLNRGIFTLRGTISNIFVNPNKWVNIDPTNDNQQC